MCASAQYINISVTSSRGASRKTQVFQITDKHNLADIDLHGFVYNPGYWESSDLNNYSYKHGYLP